MGSTMPWEAYSEPNLSSQLQLQSQPTSLSQSLASQSTSIVVRRQPPVKTTINMEKANWDPIATEAFIRICVEEVEAGNRPCTHFNKTGWDNIAKKFYETTKRRYKRVQFKNRWDALKKEWGQWMTLIRSETGLGWDHAKQTIHADEEWWARKIQSNPELAKFRFRGPLLVQEQQVLFDDVVATGADAWTPSSGILPQHLYDDQEDNLEGNQETTQEFQDDVTIDGADTEQSASQKRTSTRNGKQTVFRGRLPPLITGKKQKKFTSAEKIARCLEDMVGTMKTESSSSQPRRFSIEECMNVLDRMDGIEAGGKLWMHATSLFLKSNVRELFLAIKNDNIRRKWLQEQLDSSLQKRSSSTTSAHHAMTDSVQADNTSCG
ncbi:unnamed protein product [Cuscuta epithymum]|uniref:Myb/SANT-like domain-containing protein n=1 Tax=Cuscuta epithymum TaxID=186058 RepID=A0AAV0GGJ1_9ASTE|nr:unnamed protein product [Cuscuta epithymum]